MPFTKIWIHAVWATKDRFPYLTPPIRNKIIFHIKENSIAKNIHIDHIGGYTDHIHCLISMSAEQNIATIMNLIKGESSFWINKNQITETKFAWQSEYFAVSVSESQVEAVRQYIKKQEEHHKIKSFQDEYNEFIEKYGFENF